MKGRRAALELSLLFICGALWFSSDLAWKSARPDESAYFQGFELSMHGASPFGAPRYIYTPVFARIGAFALSHWGFSATALGLRLVNLAAACLLAWGAFSAVPSLGRARLALAALALVAFRPLTTSLTLGNLSPFAAAAAFAGLGLAAPVPIVAGVVLAVGLAVKPTGLPVLLILAVHRRTDGSRRHLAALAVAILVLVPLLAVDARYWGDLAARLPELGSAPTNLSPYRVLAALGIHLPAVVLAAILTVPCALWARVRPLPVTGLAAIAGLASLLWPPRVWLHSFVFVLPSIAMAIGGAVSSIRGARARGPETGGVGEPAARERAMLTATWILLGVTCIEIADACADLVTVFPALPWDQGLNPAIPLVAAVLLTEMATRRTI